MVTPNALALRSEPTHRMIAVDAQVVTASARRLQRRVSQPAAQRDHHQPCRSEA